MKRRIAYALGGLPVGYGCQTLARHLFPATGQTAVLVNVASLMVALAIGVVCVLMVEAVVWRRQQDVLLRQFVARLHEQAQEQEG